MESLISDLQHHYSSLAASSAVTQAILLQAISNSQQQQQQESRQTLVAATSGVPPQRHTNGVTESVRAATGGGVSVSVDEDRRRGNQQIPRASKGAQAAQFAPLDLSIKQPPAGLQSTRCRPTFPLVGPSRRHPQPLDLAKAVVRDNQINGQQPDINNNHMSCDISKHANLIKLISSSTSPTTNGQTFRVLESTIEQPDERGKIVKGESAKKSMREEISAELSANSAANDVISSTNGRRRPRRKLANKSKSKEKSSSSHLCNHCGRLFSRSDMLTRHSRLHSGLKPYQCGRCFQVFSRSDHLSTHERTHTGEKPYQCGICAYSACRRDMITRHMRTHLGERVRPRCSAKRKNNQPTTTTNTDSLEINTSRRRIRRNQRSAAIAGAVSMYCNDNDRHDNGDEGDGDSLV